MWRTSETAVGVVLHNINYDRLNDDIDFLSLLSGECVKDGGKSKFKQNSNT